jgi:hypothetical protein
VICSTSEDEVILSYFQSYLDLFLILNQNWMPVWLEEVFRLDLDCSCPSVPVFPLECHMTLYHIVGCIVDLLHLKDLLIVGHFNKTTKVMMHGDEGIGVEGLKELDPDPSTLDGIMEHGPSHIHYVLVAPLPVASNHIISAFQQGHQAFPLVKVKTTNDNTCDHSYLFSVKSFGGRTT